jgi:hypothetical protein
MSVARSFSVDVLNAAGKTVDDEKRCLVTADVEDACAFAAKLHRERAAGKKVRIIPPYDLRVDEAEKLVALGIRQLFI